MKIDGILFDFDGTLCNTIPLIVDSYHYTYKKHNKRYHTAEEIIAGIGLPLETVFSSEYPEETAELLKTYLDYNNKITPTHFGIFLGIVPMLKTLQELKVPMGIVTAKRLDNITVSLEVAELEQYFTCLVTKFDTNKHKPNPAPLILGMEKLGFADPRRILYVGDAVFDVQAAKNGNFLSAIVDWTQGDKTILRQEKPDFWLNKPDDLIEIAKKYSA